ncbi:MAG TPA: protein-L-isoaspartate(D-aspartate) O-methyltransferase [Deferrisomatales bacterium]|nr:protein-L-isoaspartate(D-aspartate) O-methyltransferase [Deferrisomatales bacterium]
MIQRAGQRRMLEQVRRNCGVEDPRVLEALGRVPRHLFVDEALRHRAYADDALPIGFAQTISKPSTVALMTAALELQPGDRVLELGTGSGYQAAVLSHLAERVYSVERIGALALRARRLLIELGLHNVEVRAGDGAAGWPGAAPFQGIIVTAAAGMVPEGLLRQLDLGGNLVIPVADGEGQWLKRIVRTEEDQWCEERLDACRFVPFVTERQ